MNARILLAMKREQRNRRSGGFIEGLHDKQATKSTSDAVITQVTQVTVEDATEKADEIEEATEDVRTLKEIWKQECDVGISYNTFLQRVQKKKWDLQKALHTPKSR